MSLSRQVKTALDETRLLMLGAQVLFGFQLNGVFQEEFANLSLASRYVDCAGQVLMAMAIGLLVAPSMQHRIVENGEDTVRIHRITGMFAGMALLPFAVSLGLGFYIVFDHVFGMTAALVGGSAFCLLAGVFWYGLGFHPPHEEPEESHARGKANAADDEDRADAHRGSYHRSRGASAARLPTDSHAHKGVRAASRLAEACPRRIAVLCRRGHHPADDARCASSHFVRGGGYAVLLHDRIVVRHPCARATGDRHCRGSLCRNLNGGHIVDAGRHSRACRALSSSLPLVCRTDGAEGAGRWAIADRASVRLLAISHRMYRRGGHTIFQTSRTAHGLEISNAAPTSGDCDPDCKKERQ